MAAETYRIRINFDDGSVTDRTAGANGAPINTDSRCMEEARDASLILRAEVDAMRGCCILATYRFGQEFKTGRMTAAA